MKIVNISSFVLIVSTENVAELRLATGEAVDTKLSVDAFIELNKGLELNKHFVTVDDDSHLEEIQVDEPSQPEVINDKYNLVVTEMQEEEVNIEDFADEDDVFLDDEILEIANDLEALTVFFNKQTKDSLKEFASTNEIALSSKADKNEIVNVLVTWVTEKLTK